jgi:hypothetical protein
VIASRQNATSNAAVKETGFRFRMRDGVPAPVGLLQSLFALESGQLKQNFDVRVLSCYKR